MLVYSAPDAGAPSECISFPGSCIGFAISRVSTTAGDSPVWLNRAATDDYDALSSGLAELGLQDIPGERAVTRSAAAEASAAAHPIRSFMWSDYDAAPGRTYTYRVWRVHETEASRSLEAPTAITVHTEPVSRGGNEVHFNRGVAGSQGYNRRFGSTLPRDKREAGAESPWPWLSHGLEEALLHFLERARGDGWAIRGACYEFTYYPVLCALGAARDRGVDVSVIYDSKPCSWHAQRREWTEHGPSALNDAAVRAAGIEDITTRRAAAPSAISHNKFFALVRGGKPQAVWTGSTNITTSGLFGHLNVGHVCGDEAITGAFLAYWEELVKDPPLKGFRPFNSTLSPVPSLHDRHSSVVFSPRDSDGALRFYSEAIRAAREGVFLTAAFGLSAMIAEGLLHQPPGSLEAGHGPLPTPPPHEISTYLLLDNEGKGRSPHFVRAVRDLPYGHVACGTHLPVDGMFPGHEAEKLSDLNKVRPADAHTCMLSRKCPALVELPRGTLPVRHSHRPMCTPSMQHVAYVHTKFLLIDPLSEAPTVVTGSANFSMASTTNNDENVGEQASPAHNAHPALRPAVHILRSAHLTPAITDAGATRGERTTDSSAVPCGVHANVQALLLA